MGPVIPRPLREKGKVGREHTTAIEHVYGHPHADQQIRANLQESQMTKNNAIVAVFTHHPEAEAAVRKLAGEGFDMKHFSIVGKGYHTEEKVIGFYNAGDRIKFWGKNGAIWGGLWSLFFGGLMLTVPLVGPVMVLGHLAGMVFAAVEGAVLVGGLGALGAALFSIGIPEDSVIQYENALKADAFLVVAHGPAEEMDRAKAILKASGPTRLDLHQDVPEPTPLAHDHAAPEAA
jgi:hypothetical protein